MPLISHVNKIGNIYQTNGEFIHSCIYSFIHSLTKFIKDILVPATVLDGRNTE